jgi:hypothetical protein
MIFLFDLLIFQFFILIFAGQSSQIKDRKKINADRHLRIVSAGATWQKMAMAIAANEATRIPGRLCAATTW